MAPNPADGDGSEAMGRQIGFGDDDDVEAGKEGSETSVRQIEMRSTGRTLGFATKTVYVPFGGRNSQSPLLIFTNHIFLGLVYFYCILGDRGEGGYPGSSKISGSTFTAPGFEGMIPRYPRKFPFFVYIKKSTLY
jgi:hypothetical protein